MPGFGVHTFKMINEAGKETYIKFHWKTQQVLPGRVCSSSAVLVEQSRSCNLLTCWLGCARSGGLEHKLLEKPLLHNLC